MLWVGAQPASADAQAIWAKKCKKCHGDDGKGDTPTGRKQKVKDMTTAEFQKKLKDAEITDMLLKGKDDAKESGHKKPISGLSEADVKELIKIVRGFKQ